MCPRESNNFNEEFVEHATQHVGVLYKLLLLGEILFNIANWKCSTVSNRRVFKHQVRVIWNSYLRADIQMTSKPAPMAQ